MNMRLAIPLLIFGHLLVPFGMASRLFGSSFDCHLDFILQSLVLLSFGTLLFFVGRWDWFGAYLRYVLLFAVAGVVVATFLRIPSVPFFPVTPNWIELAANLVIVAFFIRFIVGALTGRKQPTIQSGTDLDFPFHGSGFYVAHGGAHSSINYHYVHPAQKFALDIVKLGRFGTRANGLYPKQLEKYQIFEEPVYAPCSGTVLTAIDGFPDLTPPDHDANNKAGNHVVIQPTGTELYVLLAHLQNGSVSVKEGDTLTSGTILGRIGNTGNTSEPHLHIHCAKLEGRNFTSGGVGVPITFCGKFFVRNSIVSSD